MRATDSGKSGLGAAADPVRQVVEAVLYEGYVLWPYRRSALKNRRRWTFGGVYPEAHSRSTGGSDPCTMQTQCLLEADPGAEVSVTVRFLHVVRRTAARWTGKRLQPVDTLEVGAARHLSWDEAVEREVTSGPVPLADLLDGPRLVGIDVPAGTRREWLWQEPPASGQVAAPAGALVRSWHALRGQVAVGAERLDRGTWRLTARIRNTTRWRGGPREEVLRRAFVATHTLLGTAGGAFASLMDPPAHLRQAAEGCENVGTWPVLVGEEGARDAMLSSPIVLYDYPRVAPESPGDLFDATEIDELLTLNVLALTEEEQREACGSDPRARELIERTARLTPEERMRLHGTMRDVRSVEGGPA